MAAREPLVTDGDGKMRWLIPAKFSRTIRYAYKANLQNTDFASTADVQLTVSSKTTLKPNKRFFRNGQTIRFSGRLLSKPVPRGGVLIDLQAKVGSRWQTFKTTRTRRNGSWRTSYTFRATRGLQTYTFRARVRQDTGFPTRSPRRGHSGSRSPADRAEITEGRRPCRRPSALPSCDCRTSRLL